MRQYHGDTKTKLHDVWCQMRARCLCKSNAVYSNYGGRGITICQEWDDYWVFRYWAERNGYYEGAYLDRKDNDQGYNPDNCRWATPRQSANNRRTTRNITIDGITKSIKDWTADPRCPVAYETVLYRLRIGQEPKDAIFNSSKWS